MIWNKAAAVLTAAAMTFSALPVFARAFAENEENEAVLFDEAYSPQSYTPEEYFEFSNNTVTGYTGDETDVVIPPAIGGAAVKAIGASAFRSAGITSIVLPDGIGSIGASAFRSCGSLLNITIPASVASIGNSAFSGCNAIENVFYLGTAEQWAQISVSGGNSFLLKELLCGEAYIKTDQGYIGCTDGKIIDYKGNDTELVIPGNIDDTAITEISPSAFSDCVSFTSVTIPEGIDIVGESAFSGCTGLETLYYNAVSCDKMGSKDAPVFSGCPVKEIYIGETVKSIPAYAFYGCENAENITIPQSVLSIGYGAFASTALYGNKENWSEGALYIGDCLIEADPALESDYDIREGTRLIADGAFDECEELMLLTIPSTVQHIESEVIKGISQLQFLEVSKDNPYYSTEDNALFNKDKTELTAYPSGRRIREYSVPEGVVRIAKGVFSDNTALERVYAGETVKEIGEGAFSGCSALVSVEIDGALESIGENAFSGCVKLFDIELKEGLKAIGDGAFSDCEGLKTITIPGSVTQTGKNIFLGCGSLSDITFSEGIEEIDPNLFNGLEYTVTSIALPETVTVLSDGVFEGLTALKEVKTGEGVTRIGKRAFLGCSALESIIIPPDTAEIGEDAFSGCGSLSSVTAESMEKWCLIDFVSAMSNPLYYGAVLKIGDAEVKRAEIPVGAGTVKPYAFVNFKGLERLDIQKGVTSISHDAFSGCAGLISVNIDGSLREIGENAFSGCDNMKVVCFSGTKEELAAITAEKGNNAFTYASAYAKAYAYATDKGTIAVGDDGIIKLYSGNDTEITIPDAVNGTDVVEIPKNAFKDNTELTEVNIGNNVTRIGTGAFSGCTSLKTLRLGEQVSRIIGGAFEGCSALSDIYMWNSAELIGKAAFNDCSSIETVHYYGTESEWEKLTASAGADNESFVNANIRYIAPYSVKTENGTLYVYDGIIAGYNGRDAELVIPKSYDEGEITRIASQAFSRSKIASVIIPEGIKSIGSGAFGSCSSLTYAYIPDSVYDIGSGVFGSCVKLNRVRLSGNTENIPSAVFEGCTALKGITLPKGVKKIERSAFSLSGLQSVYIPDSVLAVGENAFSGCEALKTAVIGNGAVTVSNGAFASCTALETAVLGESVIIIGKGAFSDCAGLKRLYIPASVRDAQGAFEGCPFDMSVYYGEDAEKFDGIRKDITTDNEINYSSRLYYLIYDADEEILENAPLVTAYEYNEEAAAPAGDGYTAWSGESHGALLYKAGGKFKVTENKMLYPIKSYIRLSYENGIRSAEVSDTEKDGCTVYTAVYDKENRLISLGLGKLNGGETVIATEVSEKDDKIKIFFWNEGIVPLSEPFD